MKLALNQTLSLPQYQYLPLAQPQTDLSQSHYEFHCCLLLILIHPQNLQTNMISEQRGLFVIHGFVDKLFT